MKQVLINQGQAIVEEIPAPQVEPGTVLVKVEYSCISVGTEMSGMKTSGIPLWKRAIKQPDKVKKAIQMVAKEGIAHTRSVVQGKLTAGQPTGYSASGIIIEVGEGIEDLKPGDRVACAGAQCAHHAEVIRVPRNLTVPIPEGVDSAHASTVTLGAIALQGIRRAKPTLGETFVVIGLGILGQLTVQLLKANGCKVIGTDIDRSRIQLAKSLGLNIGIHPDDEIEVEHVSRLTSGIGADGVIITAATPSDAVVSTAFKICRKKGRVVLVGDVGLNLNRGDFYQKEIDFLISTSYGPGRYDNKYEEKGLDYPVSYVRWTENRNMLEYLNLIALEKVNVKSLISEEFPIERATEAYDSLKIGSNKPMMVLLVYSRNLNQRLNKTVQNLNSKLAGKNHIRLALIGAGGFAKGMHLPNLKIMSEKIHLQAVVSRTGHNALATAKQFGANYSTTDYQEVLADTDVDAVLIATRHIMHASMVLDALNAGKHVMVEKPLALTKEELGAIENFYLSRPRGDSNPVLLTGFNRRFSKYARRIHELIKNRSNPMVLNYTMNAGYIPLDHWVHTEEGGGRNLGEACHIYDLFTYLTNGRVLSIQTSSINPNTNYYSNRDNFIATIKFDDGSLATLTYTSLGSKDYPKEQLEIFVDGKVLKLDDYKELSIMGTKVKGIESKIQEKGQKEELESFATVIKNGGEWPIPLWQQIQATEIALEVEKQLGALIKCVE